MIYKSNFDFEWTLNPYQKDKAKFNPNLAFDCLFFFCHSSKSYLCTSVKYPEDYLQYLDDILEARPQVEMEGGEATSWWGNDKIKTLARWGNSKITSWQLAKNYHLLPQESFLVYSLAQVKEIVLCSDKVWLLKKPYSMSGNGHVLIDRNSLPSEIREPYLLEPFFEVVNSYGHQYQITKSNIQYLGTLENIVSRKGTFQGIRDTSSAKPFLGAQVLEAIQKKGYLGPCSIDTFIYKEESKLKSYQLVEINMRMTMGHVLHHLKKKFVQSGTDHALLFLSARKRNFKVGQQKELVDIVKTKLKGRGLILSPWSNSFDIVLFWYSSEDEYNQQLNTLFQLY